MSILLLPTIPIKNINVIWIEYMDYVVAVVWWHGMIITRKSWWPFFFLYTLPLHRHSHKEWKRASIIYKTIVIQVKIFLPFLVNMVMCLCICWGEKSSKRFDLILMAKFFLCEATLYWNALRERDSEKGSFFLAFHVFFVCEKNRKSETLRAKKNIMKVLT